MNSANSGNIYQTLFDSATRWPNHVAVFDGFGSITFAELLRETEELKKQLSATGFAAGVSLAIIHKNSRYFIRKTAYGLVLFRHQTALDGRNGICRMVKTNFL